VWTAWHGGVTVGVLVWRAARVGGAGVHRVPRLVQRNLYHSSGEAVKKSAPMGKKSGPSPGWPEWSTRLWPRSRRFSYQLSCDVLQICLFVKQQCTNLASLGVSHKPLVQLESQECKVHLNIEIKLCQYRQSHTDPFCTLYLCCCWLQVCHTSHTQTGQLLLH
jgi:hypothetical protein